MIAQTIPINCIANIGGLDVMGAIGNLTKTDGVMTPKIIARE